MKGTLFSADFIEDLNGDLRLLEINTDTSVTNFTQFDYSDFISLLQSNYCFTTISTRRFACSSKAFLGSG